MTRRLAALRARFRDERGMALPLALIALVVLASLSGALLAIGSNETSVAANHVSTVQAQYLAEAGLEDAFNAFRADPNLIFTATTTVANVPVSGASLKVLKFGNYAVKYQKAGGNTVRVISTGTTSSGAKRTLTAVLTNNLTVNSAIVTGGSFTLDGGPTIQGTCANVFTNGTLTNASGNVSVGTTLAPGTLGATVEVVTSPPTGTPPQIGTVLPPGQPAQLVPNISAPDFLTIAKGTVPKNQIFQLGANGQVRDGYDTVIATVAADTTYNGWKYVPPTPPNTTTLWDFIGNSLDAVNGTYYINGDATISSSPGSPLTPWETSVIATRNVNIQGNATIKPHITDTLLVAGGDVLIHGNASLGTSLYNGLVAAREQIRIEGNATINGYMIAQGATAGSGLVTGNANLGNPTINFNCGAISPPIAGTLTILSWGS